MLIKFKAYFKDMLVDFPLAWRSLFIIKNFNSRHLSKVVNLNTDIVIDGPPRCANSYNYRLFNANNDPYRSMHIATHTHHICQFKLANKWQIPSIMCLRTPSKSVTSTAALFMIINRVKKKDDIIKYSKPIIDLNIKRWEHFLLYIEKSYEGEIVILGDNKNNIQSAIANINLKFKKNYNYNLLNSYDYETAKAYLPKSNKSMDTHVLPSEKRNQIKDIIFKNGYRANKLYSLDMRFDEIRNNI